jgi:hypothetical protein
MTQLLPFAMRKDLETADRISKLTLSVMTLIFYLIGLIEGPFAIALMVVSVTVVVIYFIRTIFLKHN